LALFVPDDDVFSVVRPVLKQAFTKMSGGGKIWIEFHRDYVEGVARIMQESGYRNIKIIKDMQQNQRFITCER
jgi:release factor glutamine methyltransferase